MTDQATRIPRNTATIVAAAALLVCLVGAALALALAGWQPEAIIGLLTGLSGVAAGMLALLHKITDVQAVNAEQTRALAVITEQTNGTLRRLIRDEVQAAIHGPIPYSVADNPASTGGVESAA